MYEMKNQKNKILSEKIVTNESPETVKLSLASAMALDLKPGLFYRNAQNPCINILLKYNEGCYAKCAYCGLSKARNGEYDEKSFIKVEWPSYLLEEVVKAIEKKRERIKRICISMVTNHRAIADTLQILTYIRNRLDTPISVLLSPTIVKKKDMARMKEAGADKVGIALDAANKKIFDQLRGREVKGPHKWERYWDAIDEAVEIFGKGNVGIHMIVGLGESEKEFVDLMFEFRRRGAKTHLFSFFAEEGSPLEGLSPPPMGKYRRMQIARYLIDERQIDEDEITFTEKDEVKSFLIPAKEFEEMISDGTAFVTSGCSGKDGKVACNRPYGDSLPGDNIRSYPFKPDSLDIARIRKQIFSYE